MEAFPINHQKVLSALVYVLVVLTLVTAIYLFGSLWSSYNPDVIAGAQMIVLALGLSAVALAILKLSYRDN